MDYIFNLEAILIVSSFHLSSLLVHDLSTLEIEIFISGQRPDLQSKMDEDILEYVNNVPYCRDGDVIITIAKCDVQSGKLAWVNWHQEESGIIIDMVATDQRDPANVHGRRLHDVLFVAISKTAILFGRMPGHIQGDQNFDYYVDKFCQNAKDKLNRHPNNDAAAFLFFPDSGIHPLNLEYIKKRFEDRHHTMSEDLRMLDSESKDFFRRLEFHEYISGPNGATHMRIFRKSKGGWPVVEHEVWETVFVSTNIAPDKEPE